MTNLKSLKLDLSENKIGKNHYNLNYLRNAL